MTIEEPITIQIAENVHNVNVTDTYNRVEVNEDAPNEVTIYTPGVAGNQGPQGPQGFQGPQGIGSQGPQGIQGEDGLVESETPPANLDVLWLDTTSTGIEAIIGPQGSQGPQGTQGVQGATGVSFARECRSDWVAPNSYIGVAAAGSSESDSVWQVKRITVSGGSVTVAVASPVRWVDRLTAIYV